MLQETSNAVTISGEPFTSQQIAKAVFPVMELMGQAGVKFWLRESDESVLIAVPTEGQFGKPAFIMADTAGTSIPIDRPVDQFVVMSGKWYFPDEGIEVDDEIDARVYAFALGLHAQLFKDR